jgi:hypothetical protein
MITRDRLLLAGGVAIGLSLIGYALFSRETDEEQIRRKLDELEQAVGVSGEPENVVVRGARVKGDFAKIFDKQVRISIPELTTSTSGREDLVGLAAKAGTWFETLELDFEDVKVEAGEIGASVSTRAVLVASRRGRGLQKDDREVTFSLMKDDGDWKIDSVSVAPKPESAEQE